MAKKLYPYAVDYWVESYQDLRYWAVYDGLEWLHSQIGYEGKEWKCDAPLWKKSGHMGLRIRFRRKKDAALFKLRWV